MVLAGFYLFLVLTQLVYPSISYPDDYDDDQQSSDDAVSIYWGIADREAVVGRLFQCKIPPEKDAFKGTIVEYDVEGEKPNTLPKWLIFDKRRSILEGVATVEDIGDTRINVKAFDSKGKSVKDMFVIEVYPLENENTNTKRKCRNGEEVMMLAIVIDKNLNNISPSQRILVIRTLARTLNIPQNTILLLPQLPTLDSSTAFLQTDSNDTNVDSSVLTWQIGCNEKIWAEQLEILKLVKKMIKGNNLADMLQLPINHWRLIANFNPFRMRRHAPDMEIDEPAEEEDDEGEKGDEGEDGDEVDEEDKIRRTPTLDDQLSSVGVNETFPPFQQSRDEDNSSWPQLSNVSKSDRTQREFSNNAEDEEAETDHPDLEESIFEGQNESFSLGPTPNLESSVTPHQCISCMSTDGNVPTEKPTISPTSVRHPPRVIKNVGPIIVTAGKPRKEPIPEDIFIDEGGDGNTRNLSLKLIQKSGECDPETLWIELDSETQTLLILASSDAISMHEIPLEATNSANLSNIALITVAVQHPQQDRKINFEISLHLSRKNKDQRITTRLQLELLSLISVLYGDASTDSIMLRHISCDPLVFTWTNTSLSLDVCDTSAIHNLLMVLVNGENSIEANDKVHQTIGPLIDVEKITWVGKGLCEGVVPPARPLFKPIENYSPSVRNHVDNITARVGELLVYQIPDDAFHDPDVTSVRDLKLVVKFLGDKKPLPPNNWLQFDEKNQEIYGLPMNSDVGLTSYMVVCYDNKETGNEEKAVRQTIEVKVEPALKRPYSVKFSISLNSSYTSFDEFNRVPMLRRILVKKLSELFGDKDTNSIVVNGYQTGSLIVIWHNKTLPVETCPESEIEKLRKVILTDKNELTERVNKVLEPEFQAISASLAPTGICEGGLTETHVTEVPVKTASQEIQLFFSKMDFQYYFREYFVDVIMPIIIIILMMTFAGIVACILYRRQRRAKWNLNDETERRTYRNRGIPVIFQDELEERLETSNKSPIIMKEEKPPLPPPEYQKTLPMATTALLSDFDDPSYHQDSRSYSPRSAERSGRDQGGTPTYRKPPPYIPP